jgi:hypothetical protein
LQGGRDVGAIWNCRVLRALGPRPLLEWFAGLGA